MYDAISELWMRINLLGSTCVYVRLALLSLFLVDYFTVHCFANSCNSSS